MYERKADFPLAVTSQDDDGLRAGLQWCLDRRADGQSVTVWTRLQRSLENNPMLEQFVTSRGVEHVTARSRALVRCQGPALMACPDLSDISQFTGANANRITALCVVAGNQDRLRPWVSFAGPEQLGDKSPWRIPTPGLDPVVEGEMESLTLAVNHNNTIAAGDEKEDVVFILCALHDAGYGLDGPALAGWAVVHGWTSDNPRLLEDYVRRINQGSPPRVRRKSDPSFVADLRSRAERSTGG